MRNEALGYIHLKKLNGEIVEYKVDEDGNVDVFGIMPNTNDEGWFFIGNIYSRDFLHEAKYFLG